MKNNRTQKFTVFAIILVLLASLTIAGVLGADFSYTAYADTTYNWGGRNLGNLWYYSSTNLDLAGLKQQVNKIDLTKLDKSDPIIIAVIDTGIITDAVGMNGVFDGVLHNNGASAFNASTSKSGLDNVKDSTLTTISGKQGSELHGTSVASIIAMQIKELGLQEYIKILPIKANYLDTNEFVLETFVSAVKSASQMGADIINLSLGSSTATNWNSTALQNAINDAAVASVVVGATGNENKKYDGKSGTGAFYPAAMDNVVSVMAYEEKIGGIKAKRSSSNYGDYDVIAPGTDIWAYRYSGGLSGFGTINGTSMATPLVSNITAMLMLKLKSILTSDKIPPASVIANTVCKTNGETIEYNGYSLKTVDYVKVMNGDYTNGFEYQEPTALTLKSNLDGTVSDILGVLNVRFGDKTPIEFTAELSPVGLVNASKYNNIDWYVQFPGGGQEYLGSGKTLTYLPLKGGQQSIVASYRGSELEAKNKTISAAYQNFIMGNCRVTVLDDANKDVDKATSNINGYTRESVTFTLTGLQYCDISNLDIKWYVNGVECGAGVQFVYQPSRAGNYKIWASIKDMSSGSEQYVPVANEHSLLFSVSSFMSRPLEIFTMVSISSMLIAAVAVVVVIVVRNKKTMSIK